MNDQLIWKRLILAVALLAAALIGSETVWAVDTIQFEKASCSTNEGSQTDGNFNVAKLIVTRKGNFKNEAVVTVKTEADGTATPNKDFSHFEITWNFRGGENSKTLNIPITPDLLPERDETFFVELSNIGPYNKNKPDDPNNVRAGQITRAEVTIVNDDPWAVLEAPTNVKATDGESKSIVKVTWDYKKPVPDDVFFTVWRSADNNSKNATQLNFLGNVYFADDDKSAKPGVNYYYWVAAESYDSGASAFSAGDSGFCGAPPKPAGVKASNGLYQKVRVTWNAASDGVLGYTILRNTKNDSRSATKIGTSRTTAYEDTTASRYKIYYYWVQARNSIGLSEFSVAARGRASALASTGFTPSSGGTNPSIAPYVIINGQVYGREPGDAAALQANAEISDTLKVEIYLQTAEETSKEVKDWWVLGRVNDAIYVYSDGCWKTLEDSAAPTYAGAPGAMSAPYIVLEHPVESLPSGVYTFFFGWDTNADGMLDLDKLVGATGEVIVQ